MTILGLRDAARAAGISRQTIYRYAASGRLSVTQRQDGTQGVDTSELMRVFGPLEPRETVSESRSVTPQDSPDSRLLQSLQAELEMTRQALKAAQESLNQANERETQGRERENRLLDILDRQTRLLEHKPAAPRARTETAKKKKSDKKKDKRKKGKKP